MEAAVDLNIMLGDEQSELHKMQQEIKIRENEEYRKCGKMTIAKNLIAETDEYRKMRDKESRVKNIEEFIRLGKARAKMASGNY